MSPAAIQTQPANGVAVPVKESAAPVPAPAVAELDASKLTYTYTTLTRTVPGLDVAVAGSETICTDHMITADWTAAAGWTAPALKPYGPLTLMPTASVLHYATECFEGLKVYRGHDGKLRTFRPDRNADRFRMSASRISLPPPPPAELVKLILALLAVDGPKWLPKSDPGTYLYIRPTLIGTQSQLGVQAPSSAMLYIIVTYLPRLDSPPGGLRLQTSPEDMVRAWAGGFGYAKVGANYGPSLQATAEARTKGFHQILWLYGPNGECTEAGASNFFVVWNRKEDGKKELITAPLDDKLILDGVTRRSCLELARQNLGNDLIITERKYSIDELVEADAEGRILESFAAGTAVSFTPINNKLHFTNAVRSTLSAPSPRSTTVARISTSPWAPRARPVTSPTRSRAGSVISCTATSSTPGVSSLTRRASPSKRHPLRAVWIQ